MKKPARSNGIVFTPIVHKYITMEHKPPFLSSLQQMVVKY